MSRKPNIKRVGDILTDEDLKKYHKEQDEKSQAKLFAHMFERVILPRAQNHKYRPHRWR